MANTFLPCIIAALLSCNGAQGNNKVQTNDSIVSDSSINTQSQIKETVSMSFVGDVMMGTNFPNPTSYITKDRGATLFKDCDSLLSATDIAIANLEGTLYDGTDGELRKMTNPNTYFIFRTPGDHVKHLVNAGIDAVCFSNNHSFDFGQTGREKTIATLKNAGIGVAGIRDLAEGCVIERDGVKFGYISFAATCTKVLDMLDTLEIDSMVRKYRKLCDVMIVGFHGGAEGTAATHVPKKEEWYVGEDRGNVWTFAHRCIDLGADIVVGHGPHVPRAVELYKGHLIAYSLGNFCAPFRLGASGIKGYAPILETNIDTKTGKFISGKIHSLIQVGGVGPRTDANKNAAKLMRQLTESDFPDTGVTITLDGEIKLK